MLSNLNIIKAEFYNFAFIIKIIFTTIFSLIVFNSCKNQKIISAASKKPLVVFLHGYGGNKSNFKMISENLNNDFDILLLDGFKRLNKTSFSWGIVNYDSITNTWFEKKSNMYSIFKLRDFFKNENRTIILVGESQGASIGYSLVLNYPEKFKYLIAINGYVDNKLLINKYKPDYSNTSILRLNGSNDFVINKDMVNSSTAILDSLTISNSLVFHSENHSYSSAEVDLINMWIGNLNSTLYEKN